jgi:uncharacterized phiE125 gp8 family phage protein
VPALDGDDNPIPPVEPVTIREVRNQAHIDDAHVNQLAWIAAAIIAAREKAEIFIKRRFVSTTLRLSLDAFPTWEFYLPSPPLVSVTSIKYRDQSNVQQTVSSSDYTVDTYSEPGRITPAYGGSWPDALRHTNSIEVVYVAGYGDRSSVPMAIKQAILMTVATWNENRENLAPNMMELPDTAKALLQSHSWGYLA